MLRLTVTSVALQTLAARLLGSGALNTGDLIAMRETGLQLAADLVATTGESDLGKRLAVLVRPGGMQQKAWPGCESGLGSETE